MTRLTVKTGLVALSLVITLGSWAVLAQDDSRPKPVPPEAVVQPLDLPPIPTLVRPPAARGGSTVDVPGPVPLDLPPIPAVSAPVPRPRPFTRTRSSR